MRVTADESVGETKVEFFFDEGPSIVLEEIRPECRSPYWKGTDDITEAQSKAIKTWSNLGVK